MDTPSIIMIILFYLSNVDENLWCCVQTAFIQWIIAVIYCAKVSLVWHKKTKPSLDL